MRKRPLPLSGIRVLDLTQTLAGPFGTMILGDLGAEVIKIENPASPDVARNTPPYFIRGESTYFLSLNRNKKSLALDLKSPRGREVFDGLVRKCDVVFHNFRPGTPERLGVGYRRLRRLNPRLIYCALTGYGLTGPWSHKPGYDYVIQALSGHMALTGEPGGPPTKTYVSIVDHVGGIYAALGVLAALESRRKTRRGMLVDVSLLDSFMSLFTYSAAAYLNHGAKPKRIPNSGHPYIVPVQNFEAKDGTLVVMAMNDRFWRKLCAAIGRPQWADDPRYGSMQARFRNRKRIIAELKRIFRTRTVREWTSRLEAHDVVCGPVSTLDRALRHPQVLARDMILTVGQPKAGRIRVLGNPIKMTDGRSAGAPPPSLGRHSREILSNVAGCSRPEIDGLIRAGVVIAG